ncbi:MAG TPA: PDZ domain-containing protein [Candidatus Polarisedimenticolia bacterium]|nr:PDZ domain-containing protein [Candidatus Polarisedimenticolia bacterium]
MKPMPLRRNLLLWVIVVLAAIPAKAPAQAGASQPLDGPTKLLRFADISKDKVVFAYAGDLWIASREGGAARRLTSHVGDELYPKFSPDGKWIAFTGEYDGNPDVYVISSEGGEPKRLTFHPGNDIVLGWTPDGKDVLFRSDRFSAPPGRYTKLFLVSPQGGPAKPLQVPRASLTSFSPDGTKIAYLETSQEFRTWKRYRGGWSLPIAIFDLKKNSYQELRKTAGMDLFPMWHGNTIYFISDRDGVMNLFSYDLSSMQTKKLTDYKEYDVKWPSLGPDAIVYENGGVLYEFNLASGKTRNLPIVVRGEDIEARPEFKNVAQSIGSYSLSPSAARALVEARGNIFTIPAEHGSIRTQTTNHSGVHELNPAWSPDGKWVAYLSDKTGEFELYTRPQMGGEETPITADGSVYRYGPVWSPDSKKLLYWDKVLRLWYISLEDKKPVLVDKSDYGTISDGSWSPDSWWIAYSKPHRRGSSDVFLYSLGAKKITMVSSGFYNDNNPVFDDNGKYLYFISTRYFYPSVGQLDQRFNYYSTDGVFAVTLKADEASPFKPQSDEEKAADEKKDEKKDDKKGADTKSADKKLDEQKEEKKDEKKDEKKPEAVKPMQIDLEGIGSRLAPVPISAGILSNLAARKDKFFYLSTPQEARQFGTPDRGPRNVLHVYDLTKREDKALLEGIDGYDLDKEGKKVIYKAGPVYGIVEATPGKAKVGEGKLNLSELQVKIDPREEWREVFHEAWRVERDFYWDPNMTGHNWKKIGERYEALLPWVAHRSDLNYIIGEMIAELSTSHTYVGGGDQPTKPHVSVGMLGADFEPDGGYFRITKIYPGENWNDSSRSPLTEPGLKVKAGDYLIAVDGQEAHSNQDVYSYFQDLAGKLVTMKINSKSTPEGAWEITVKAASSEAGPRYLDWMEVNRRKVAEETAGRIGYMHVPDTSFPGIIAFDKQFTAQLDKDGIIVDERYNSGGQIPDFYTEKLRRELLAALAPREGKDVPWPPVAIYGPKVMIVNELAGSGGDAFPWFFHRQKIGPIVGTRTWGGLVGISRGIPLHDGGNVTAPEFAFWSPDNGSEWIVENHGVDPDYVVPQRPDLVVSGRDPQLEKAIELAKEELKNYKGLPPRPKYPVVKE